MSVSLYELIRPIATWPVVALLLVAFILCVQAFSWGQRSLGYQHEVLDVRFWYTPEDASKLLESLGERGRRLYAWTRVTLDVVFPVVYGTLFAVLITRLYQPEAARQLLLIPFGALVADLLENSMAAYLAWSYDGQESKLAWAALAFTLAKFLLFGISLVVLVVGGIIGLSQAEQSA